MQGKENFKNNIINILKETGKDIGSLKQESNSITKIENKNSSRKVKTW